jgi:membrane associated rhomboid family serine protease
MFIPLHDGKNLKHIGVQYVTILLIVVNAAVWVFLSGMTGSSEDMQMAAVFSYGFIPVVALGQESLPLELQQVPAAATFVTYSFMHGDLMHLIGNMLFIWVFGDNVEDAMGHLKFLAFYLLCAAAGAFVHMLAMPQSEVPLIGASGAAAGIITAYLMLHPHVRVWVLALGKIPLRLSAAFMIGLWIAFQVFKFVSSDGDRVSWAAHVGGILAGAALLPVLKRRGVALFDRDMVTAGIQEQPADRRVEAREEAAQEPQGQPEKASMPWGRQPRDEA